MSLFYFTFYRNMARKVEYLRSPVCKFSVENITLYKSFDKKHHLIFKKRAA